MRAIITRTILPLLTFAIFLVSCQKEVSFDTPPDPNPGGGGSGGGGGGNSTANITGDYDFVGMTAKTLSTITVDAMGDELKSVTTSHYDTKTNTGTVKITANQFITNNMSYSIDTTLNAKTYLNNALMSDMDMPFVASVPATSSISTYVRFSSDSITITGALGLPNDPSGQTPTGPVGVKLSWSGDTLIMKVKTSFTQTITQGGVPGQFFGAVEGTTRLKKK